MSLTSSALDGFINRTFMRNGFLYAATYRKGIQAIDLGTVIDGFKAPGTNAFFQMSRALFTDGRGFGQENVLSIPVSGPPLPGCEAPGSCPPSPARLEDLEAGPLGPEGRLAVVATGDTGLTIADPGTLQVLSSGAVTVAADSATLTNGRAIGLGKVAGYDIAVLAGWGTAQGEPQTLVMVADISNPAAPVGLGWTVLEDATVGDILVKDDLALLGGSSQVTVVSLTDPTQPRVTGTLSGVGGRLALTDSGLLYSTARSVFGGETELGGIRTAALGHLAIVRRVSPMPIVFGPESNASDRDVNVDFAAVPGGYEFVSAEVRILKDGLVLDTLVPQKEGSEGRAVWPSGAPIDLGSTYQAQAVFDAGTAQEMVSAPRLIPPIYLDLDIDSDNNNQLADPLRTDAEDAIEDVAGDVARPGKVVFVNDGDTDGDGLPDYADGHDRFGDGAADASGRFTPLIVQLPRGARPRPAS